MLFGVILLSLVGYRYSFLWCWCSLCMLSATVLLFITFCARQTNCDPPMRQGGVSNKWYFNSNIYNNFQNVQCTKLQINKPLFKKSIPSSFTVK